MMSSPQTIRRSCAVLLTFSLVLPLVGLFAPRTQGQTTQANRPNRNRVKLADDLRDRVRAARPGSREKTRVILNMANSAAAASTRAMLQNAGASVRNELDQLNVVVADVPVEKLEEMAARTEVSWISADNPVRSLAATPDNTSHAAVTTGASKVLPQGNENVAKGGAGNGIGIAILDSGISPPDAAEFAGYKWQQSGGTLGLGLFSQSYLESYTRIKKRVDFTGEPKSADAYGHGTHTAGVAAGTGQASEDYAARNPAHRPTAASLRART